MLKTIPFAFRTGKSSKGLEMAQMAASAARVLPLPVPMPMRAVPALPMTALTSAKSTLMSPGFTMISEMPTTPCRKMSSATRKESVNGVFGGTICRSLSFETTISVSTLLCSVAMAAVAWLMRLRPSKANGLVTTPTVSAPSSLATSATTGAAPLPVPPPMPAVTKTRSAPSTILRISSRLSSAAFFPMSGLPPAPSPRVFSAPIASVFFDRALASACWSVFTLQNSTPKISVSTILLTALPPPPPTPTTLMTQGDPAKPRAGAGIAGVEKMGSATTTFLSPVLLSTINDMVRCSKMEGRFVVLRPSWYADTIHKCSSINARTFVILVCCNCKHR
mmetsp:Transcript_69182/g.139187  ORF Transcript_69182/g.139187 Transcript_69182/m.139187 type:complete len:335 (-) Transcript_69182:61-1065(-)